MPQDLPPIGGYDPIQYKRNLPARGFRPAVLLFGMASIMTYGFWRVGQGIREHNELAREKMWSRIHLIPMLTAEEDRDLVRRHLADLAREKKLLGSSTSPYNSERYVRPTFAITPKETTK
ncbi:putative nadh-ubiquinone oxidoreductase subunit grim-19 [Erysiphe necator]|uniref:NADH dehydrogenase [ubiquinone] 1 alpha subcomplex subunit 13 n=1 Tax=Uncinula necator TaxID=52586 RepID=A0A0B1P954_UNCNE|nr:putative nadh-ubiquinone oxidoreductase subunit grim-19 [Erysiphe necator]